MNPKEINYIIYKNRCKKNILYTNFFHNKLNILNILNRNKFLTEICFFYHSSNNKLNNIVEKKNVFSKHWYWPLNNSEMKFFYNYSTNNKGINIVGIEGQPVFSVAKGKVVYIGDFFKNYGKLIIIQHNNTYLSMYGFNKNILVHLNDQVYEHQKISTMGSMAKNLARLYFEIRFKGKPINLLNLFPYIKLKKY